MLKFLTAIVLIGLSITGFFLLTSPVFGQVTALRTQVGAYNEALNNAKALEDQRDLLTTKYNNISPDDLDRLEKMVPDSVDNIRLILEIENLAVPYGMVLKNVEYDDLNATDSTDSAVPAGDQSTQSLKDYGSWQLEFSTTGTYTNFLNFLAQLEQNLRIIDISSIDFSSSSGPGASPGDANQPYTYNFKIQTYWLKN